MTKTIKTITDLAELAGVSPSTVSRALNNNPLINKKTRRRIQTLAKEHQFETNKGARCLALKNSQTIALVIPESSNHSHFVTDPFFVEALKGITYAIKKYDYDLLIGQPRHNVADELASYLESKRADGIIYLGCCQKTNIPSSGNESAAIITCGSEQYDHICSVECDNWDGGRLAAQHLLDCGCQNLAFIGGPNYSREVKLRFQGYSEVLNSAGIEIDPSNIVYGDYTSPTGYNLMLQLLEQNPDIDGLFACSDLMAMGSIKAIREKGRFPGSDIAVVGFDDIPMAEYFSPSITTIRQNIFKVGEVLVHKLMQYLKDEVTSKSILPVELVVRKSSMMR